MWVERVFERSLATCCLHSLFLGFIGVCRKHNFSSRLVDLLDASGLVSAKTKQSEESERQDLERYLDVTRGEMLLARGVLVRSP